MNYLHSLPSQSKEYLTVEQRKVVNWYRRVFQVRTTALLVFALGPLLRALENINARTTHNPIEYFSQHPQTLSDMASQISVQHANDSALELFGYACEADFVSQPLARHIRDYDDALRLLCCALLEKRQHIEIEACARHQNGNEFKASLELVLPLPGTDGDSVIVSVAFLSDAEPLSVMQFDDKTLYARFVDHAPVCIHEIDQDGRLDKMNTAGLQMMQVADFDQIRGHAYLDLVGEDDRARIETLLKRAQEGYSSEFEFTLTLNGSSRIFTSCFIPMERKADGKRRIVGVTQDITERKASEEELYRSANYDQLTQLRNGPNFLDAAQQVLAQASRHKQQLAVLFIDLDNFKPVNDTFGHDVGDMALQEFSSKLRSVLREEDLACRFGGDEFVVLLPYIEHPEDARDVALRLIKLLELPFASSGLSSGMYASIGISIYPKDGSTAKALIRHADEAMYQAKRAGGHRVCFYQQ